MSPIDITHQHVGRWHLRPKASSHEAQAAAKPSEAPRVKHSVSKLCSALVGRKFPTTKPSALAKEEESLSKAGLERTKGRPGETTPEEQPAYRAGPEYGTQEVAVLNAPAASAKAVTEASSTSKLKQFSHPIRLAARFGWKSKPIDILKDQRVEIRQAWQVIMAKSWTGEIAFKSSFLSMGEMAQAAALSPETRKLLETGADDFHDFKEQEQENQKREEKEREELAKIEKEREVSKSQRVERLRPASSMLSLGTLDPRASETTSRRQTIGGDYAGYMLSSRDTAKQATEDDSSSRHYTPIIDRSRPISFHPGEYSTSRL